MGEMGTTETVLLVGGGLVLLYMFMKPTTPALPSTVYVPNPGAAQAAANASTTNTLYNDSTNVFDSFINALS